MEPLDENTHLANLLNYQKVTVPFYVSLGRFLHQYSVLENTTLIVLINVSGVTDKVGKSVHSGTRVKGAIDYINRILDATDRQALKSSFKPYFDHIGLLTSMRDDILHYGAVYDHRRNALVVSNQRVAHTADKLRTFEVDPPMLDAMATDAQRAVCGLTLALTASGGRVPPDALAYLQSQVAVPWQYKPPRPTARKP